MVWTRDRDTGIKHAYPNGDLVSMDIQYGYWLYSLGTQDMSITGSVLSSTIINVYSGWNLIGVPSATTRTFESVLTGVSWDRIMTMSSGTGGWLTNDTDKPASHNDIDSFEPGRSYWIFITSDDLIPFAVVEEGPEQIIIIEVLAAPSLSTGATRSSMELPSEAPSSEGGAPDGAPKVLKGKSMPVGVSAVEHMLMPAMMGLVGFVAMVAVVVAYKKRGLQG